MPDRAWILAFGILLLCSPAYGQDGPFLAHQAPRFASWQPAGLASSGVPLAPLGAALESRRRTRNALIGGAIGAVAGLAVCTAISNLTDDRATGFSTCTWKGYLLTGGIGFGAGFAVGWSL